MSERRFERGQKVRVTEKYKATPNPFDGGMEVAPGAIGEVKYVPDDIDWSEDTDPEDQDTYEVVFPNGHWDMFHPDEIEEVK
jgi:hypothetical protein